VVAVDDLADQIGLRVDTADAGKHRAQNSVGTA
jgi:hypothetical protein